MKIPLSLSRTRPTVGIATLSSVFKIKGVRGHLNNMTEEEIKALQEKSEAAERRAAEAEAAALAAKAEADKAKGDITNIVEELKQERLKKAEALAKANINNGETDVNSLIEQALQAKESERRKSEAESAIAEFKASKTEFQNDASGLVFDKFKSELSKHNLSDLSSKEQVKSRLDEIYRFVNFKGEQGGGSDYEGTPRTGSSVQANDDKLNPTIESAIAQAKMSTEKYTALKGKYGDAFSSLGIN